MKFLKKVASIAAPIVGGIAGSAVGAPQIGAAAGNLLGGAIAGSDKSNRPDSFITGQNRQGYQTLFDIPRFNQQNNSFVGETLPQALIDVFNTPYFARPTRRLMASDLEDEIFAPVAVREWQNYNDIQAPMKAQQGADAAEKKRLEGLGRQYVQDYIQQANLNPAYAQTLQNRKFDYGEIAKAVMDAIKTPHTNTAAHDILKQQGLGLVLNAGQKVR